MGLGGVAGGMVSELAVLLSSLRDEGGVGRGDGDVVEGGGTSGGVEVGGA